MKCASQAAARLGALALAAAACGGGETVKLEVLVDGMGTVVVTAGGSVEECTSTSADQGETCVVSVPVGEDVELAATPGPGWGFYYWGEPRSRSSDPCTGTVPTVTLAALEEGRSCSATFLAYQVTLSVFVQGEGSVHIEDAATHECLPECQVEGWTQGTLTAVPGIGYHLDRWEGAATGSDLSVMVTQEDVTATVGFNRLVEVTAVFARDEVEDVLSGTVWVVPQVGTVSAAFTRFTPGAVLQTTETVGPCRVDHFLYGIDPEGTTTYLSGGDVSAAGSLATTVAMQGPGGTYFASGPVLGAPGSMLTFSSTGGDAPAIPATDLVVGADITLATILTSGQSVQKSVGLAIDYAGGTVGELHLLLVQDDTSVPQRVLAQCTYDAAGTLASVPPAALTKFVDGLGANLVLTNRNQIMLPIGDFEMTLSAAAQVRDSSGNPQPTVQVTITP